MVVQLWEDKNDKNKQRTKTDYYNNNNWLYYLSIDTKFIGIKDRPTRMVVVRVLEPVNGYFVVYILVEHSSLTITRIREFCPTFG